METHEQAAQRLLGWPARMLSHSKTGYHRRHPDHVAIFNAGVFIAGAEVWWGDLDLTLDEPRLAELAAAVRERVAVLYEGDRWGDTGRSSLIERAVLVVDPEGTTTYDPRQFIRDEDGTLRHKQWAPAPEPAEWVTPYDWDGRHRPRLFKFWRVAHRHIRNLTTHVDDNVHLVYLGEVTTTAAPLLLLAVYRRCRPVSQLGLELIWFPTRRRWRRRPLADWTLRLNHGPLRPGIRLRLQPGRAHTLVLTLNLGRRDG